MPKLPPEPRIPEVSPEPQANRVSLGELSIVFALAAVLVVGFDAANELVVSYPDVGPWWSWLAGAVHLLTWIMPWTVPMAVATWLLVSIVRATPWLDGWRERLGDPRRLFAADPEGIATMAAVASGVAFYVVTARKVLDAVRVVIVTERYRDLATIFATLGLALVAVVVVASTTSVVVRAVATKLRPIARPILPLVLAVLAGAILALRRHEHVVAFFDGPVWKKVAATPVAILGVLVALLCMRIVALALGKYARFLRFAPIPIVPISVVALVISAFTYRAQSVRERVESESLYGLKLYRFYSRFADFDHDGSLGLFGGADCDDTRSDVHPGALDPPGDGVDADCFGGDGTPLVAPLGSGHFSPIPSSAARPNVVLVTVDALRADALGSFGARHATPNIDRLAQSGARFTYAVSSSSRTVTAMPSMMTGRYPSQVERGPEYFYPSVAPQNVMLAERLKEAGYLTAAVAGTRFFGRVNGYFQGFDIIEQSALEKAPRAWAVDRALERLDVFRAMPSKPFFLWVHLFNAHAEYLQDGAASRYGDDPRAKYDTEVALADEQVGRLLDGLRVRGLDARTLIVLTGDHGEAFGEHGTTNHEFLFEEELRVPLVVRAPGFAPTSSPELVSTVDIAPTVLNFAGMGPAQPVAGWSLVPLLSPAPSQAVVRPWRERYVVSERLPDGWVSIHELSLRQDKVRLTWFRETDRLALYDLRTDPGQQTNLADAQPDRAREMAALLSAWLWATGAESNVPEKVIRDNRLAAPPARMTKRLNLRYPFFEMLGYDLPKTTYRRGENIEFTFYYRVIRPTSDQARFGLTFTLPANVNVDFFHGEHEPLQGFYPTTRWRAGEILRDRVSVPVPSFAPTGIDVTVRLRVGMSGVVQTYDSPTGPQDWLDLPTIHIVP